MTAHKCHQATRFDISIDPIASSSSSLDAAVPSSSSSNIVVRPYSALSSIQSVHRTAFIGVSIAVGLFGIVVLITRKWPSTTHTLQTAQTTDRRDSVAMLETDDMVAFSKSQPGRAVYPPTIRAYTSFRDPMATQIYAPPLSSLTTALQRPQCTAYSACTNKHALVNSSTFPSRLKIQERVTE